VKAGEHVGYISCNELLLFKLPMDVFQDAMLYQHHEKPREEADKIRVQIESLQGQRDSNGKSLVNVEGEGLSKYDQNATKLPVFSG